MDHPLGPKNQGIAENATIRIRPDGQKEYWSVTLERWTECVWFSKTDVEVPYDDTWCEPNWQTIYEY